MKTSWLLSLSAILAGIAVPLSLAPFNFWPLMFVGVGGFFYLQHIARSAKESAWFGWLFGVGYFGLGVSWIYGSMQTVDTPIWLALILTGGFCLLMALFHAFQGWFYGRFLRQLPWALLLVAPLWWVLNEWFREWFLTGMPWLYAGYAFTDLPIGQLAAIVGIYGLSLILAVSSALGLSAFLQIRSGDRRKALGQVVAVVLLLVGSVTVGILRPASSWVDSAGVLEVAAVQSNIDQRVKWSAAQQRPTLEFYGDSITRMKNVDLVLWPEAAMTRLPDKIPYFLSQIDTLGKNRDQAIITGTLTQEDGRYFNAMRGYGQASGEYRKQHLVPFGEYVPLENWLRGLIAFFDLPMSTMIPAGEPQAPIPFEVAGQPYFAAPVICYEAAYPGLVRQLARDAGLITVVSNDAWFGDSLGPHQHLQITQMRAIENGRPILRATQNGISALIDANGRIVQRTDQFVSAELIGEMTLSQNRTPFQTLPRALVIWLSGGALLILFILNWRKNSVRST
ncbi:apolipoprotein N-acyltransferase [Reinekea blandensis]|uniref:Apolipoprotein N-acyltransferase n=1 Tax=Reinekea blandensis MED297 TaxID=314283 RepID=A4BKL8_9GAMM|nr:apolipoprotein N-acyltransferase [Reinekea blandensis]EAR07329.1 apolipoprotein N-acyltransferase [Reinekea sp. MED297] [Reinekea blandensis MED297]